MPCCLYHLLPLSAVRRERSAAGKKRLRRATKHHGCSCIHACSVASDRVAHHRSQAAAGWSRPPVLSQRSARAAGGCALTPQTRIVTKPGLKGTFSFSSRRSGGCQC
jgi:hypothetical protein